MGVLCDLYTRGRPRLLNCTHKPAVKCWLMMRPEPQTERQQSNLWTLQSVLRIIPSHKYHPIHSARTHIHARAHYKVTARVHTHKHTVIGFRPTVESPVVHKGHWWLSQSLQCTNTHIHTHTRTHACACPCVCACALAHTRTTSTAVATDA